jgi:putative FmdB family regulatory protein
MATYTFKCKACKSEFTVMRSMSEYDKPARCVCGRVSRERVMSSPLVKMARSGLPSSNAEKLAGRRVKVPEVKGATSVLGHACHSGCSH